MYLAKNAKARLPVVVGQVPFPWNQPLLPRQVGRKVLGLKPVRQVNVSGYLNPVAATISQRNRSG